MHTPELTKRQEKILTAYSRLLEGLGKNSLACTQVDFLQKVAIYGFRSIMVGDIPENVKEEARDWLKAAHEICKEKGLDSTGMFADEIIEIAMIEYIQLIERSRKRFLKALDKMSRLAYVSNISALEKRTTIIGDNTVDNFEFSYRYPLLFTDDDKEKLFSTKSETVESILEAIKTLPDPKWSIGMDREKTTLAEFVKYSQLATWITIEDSWDYYCNRQEREKSGVIGIERSYGGIPSPNDDMRGLYIRFCLYPTFDQSEEKEPVGGIYFSVDGEISW